MAEDNEACFKMDQRDGAEWSSGADRLTATSETWSTGTHSCRDRERRVRRHGPLLSAVIDDDRFRLPILAHSRPGEDVGGQVAQAQPGLPGRRLVGPVPRLVQPGDPLGGLAQAGPVRHVIRVSRAFIPS